MKAEAKKMVALDWEASVVQMQERSARRDWWMIRICWAITLASVLALAILAPFYKVVPVVLQVDRATGEAAQVEVGKIDIKISDAMSKHWVSEYVQRRERYSWNLLQLDYDITMALSDEQVKKSYRAIYNGENALDKKLGEGTEILVSIVSVTLPPGEAGKAIVRFRRQIKRANIEGGTSTQYVASISYKYEQPSRFVKEKVLIANPMGFTVDGYVVDSEISASTGAPAASGLEKESK